jgi:hypothetical protein
MLCLVCRSVYSVENPYRLTRDIVIKSAFETAGQLDFQFLSGKVLVGSGVTVTLENLVVRNIRWAAATAVAATAAVAVLVVSLAFEHMLVWQLLVMHLQHWRDSARGWLQVGPLSSSSSSACCSSVRSMTVAVKGYRVELRRAQTLRCAVLCRVLCLQEAWGLHAGLLW